MECRNEFATRMPWRNSLGQKRGAKEKAIISGMAFTEKFSSCPNGASSGGSILLGHCISGTLWVPVLRDQKLGTLDSTEKY